MDLAEKQTVMSVKESTSVIDGVAQATRIFLGVAIGAGFFASVMGAATSISVGQSGGGTSKNQPLKVSDIVQAISFLDFNSTQSFTAERYVAGGSTIYTQPEKLGPIDTPTKTPNNQPLTILRQNTVSRTPRWFLGAKPAQAQATMFSIEPVPFTGLVGQYILLRYRLAGEVTDRNITLCLGQTDATTVYVGSDGSTYTDGKLTKRTTSRSCGNLMELTSSINAISEGFMAKSPQADASGRYVVARFGYLLGRFETSSVIDNQNTPPFLVGGPILMNFDRDISSTALTVPAAIFNLADSASIPGQTAYAYLCYPASPFDPDTSLPARYFDRDGNAYEDMFLDHRVTATSCPAMTANSLRLTDITNIQMSTNATAWPNQEYRLGRLTDQDLASISPNGGYHDTDLTIPDYPVDPLAITGQRNTSTTTQTIPASSLVVTGLDIYHNPVAVTLCVPPVIIPGLQTSPAYYYDSAGKPYRDIFLTSPVDCMLTGGSAGSVPPPTGGPTSGG